MDGIGSVDLLAPLVMVAGFVVAMLLLRRRHKQQSLAWERIAKREGLTLDKGGFLGRLKMSGLVDGVPVKISVLIRGSGNAQVRYTVVRATSPVSLPHGLQVSREGIGASVAKLFGGQDIQLGDSLLDPDLRIRGVDEDVIRQVLKDGGVRPILPRLVTADPHSRIERDDVVLEEKGRKDARLEHNLGTAVALAKALGAAVQQPWMDLAERTGLALRQVDGGVQFDGSLDGLRVAGRVLLGRSDPGTHTTVRVTLPATMPAMGISLLDRTHLRGDRPDADLGLRLGDPVLDGLIRVDARQPDKARALLTGPIALETDLHGKLLAVVHGHPGSVVTSREVRVVSPGATAEHAGELVDLALDLARALCTALSAAEAAARSAGEEPAAPDGVE
ncbi:MAG: hypothetical protein GXP62_18670, partial [Oligoflexia bacterium]|nr:hypothetical protein [Oligoflexia bacterium]